MPTRHLLYQKDYPINDYIRVMIPTVGEVLENEDNYYSMVSMLTAMPIDMMVQLDDIGIDFTTINEWELFLLLFNSLKEQDTSLIFGDFDLKPFQPAINPQNGNVILVNKATGVRIDRALHGQIAAALRKIHHLEKDNRKPANGEAREYMIERMRKKLRRKVDAQAKAWQETERKLSEKVNETENKPYKQIANNVNTVKVAIITCISTLLVSGIIGAIIAFGK